MKSKKIFNPLVIVALIGVITLSIPSIVIAQDTNPPAQETQEMNESRANDILVFEPQFYWELPLSQGFKITFNFGMSFEVPMELSLVSEDAFNLFLRFRSYIREDALESTGTPEPEVTPTPEP